MKTHGTRFLAARHYCTKNLGFMISFRIPLSLAVDLDVLQEERHFYSRSELVRTILMKYISEYKGLKEKIIVQSGLPYAPVALVGPGELRSEPVIDKDKLVVSAAVERQTPGVAADKRIAAMERSEKDELAKRLAYLNSFMERIGGPEVDEVVVGKTSQSGQEQKN